MNDVDFPVARVLEGIAAAARGRPARSRSTPSSSAASTTPASWRWRGASAAPATSCASSSTWTWARPTAGGSTTWCRRARSSSASTPCSRSSRSRPPTAARSPAAGATADGQGEIGVIASVTQPFCGDCTRARLSADGQLFTCLFATRGTDLRAAAPLGRDRRGAHRGDRRRLAGTRPTATPSVAPRRRPTCVASRCPTSAADALPARLLPWTRSAQPQGQRPAVPGRRS